MDDKDALYYTTNNHYINKYFLANETTLTCFVGVSGVTGRIDGPPGIGRLSSPLGLEFDICGNLFVADSGLGFIKVVNKTGYLTTAGVIGGGTGGNKPAYLTFDSLGNLYFTELRNPVVKVVTWNLIQPNYF